MSDIRLIVNTIRYMTFRQWKYRILYTIRDRIIKRHPCRCLNIIDVIPLSLNYKNNLLKFESVENANKLLNNSFVTVSGIIKSFGEDIDWDLKNENYRLAVFKLNSFRYLLDLSDAYKVSKDKKYINKGFELIDKWWNCNGRTIEGDKWNPYVIAERLMNWIGFCSEYCGVMERNIFRYARYIYQQAVELRRTIEYQLGANHLLSEGKALLICGAFLKNNGLYRYGKKLLLNEYEEQFFSDGGHYERSISYHIESLQQYFEGIAVMTIIKDAEMQDFIKVIKPAYQYLYGMIQVNGEIPLFNDSAKDYPFENAAGFISTGDLLYSASIPGFKKGDYYYRWNWIKCQKESIKWTAQEYYPETGYLHHKFCVGKENYSLLFDVSNGGPDSNMGHTHADALSVILANSSKEILVDSGVYTYKPGNERTECRSTKAHNTVEVDGMNSCEIWSAFRVAKRGHTIVTRYSNENGHLSISAVHDGYCKCLKTAVTHERMISKNASCIEIQDKLIGKNRHNAIARFHIGRDCKVEIKSRNECLINNLILIKCSEPIYLTECEIAEYFGLKEKTKCIEILLSFSDKGLIKTQIMINNSEEKND